MGLKRYFILFVFLLGFTCSKGISPALVIEPGFNASSFQGIAEYHFDSLGRGFGTIRELSFSNDYKRNWYDQSGSIWIRFTVDNRSDQESFIFTVDQWEEADLYVQTDSVNWNKISSGTLVPVRERPEVLHRLISFSITHRTGASKTYYLRVKSYNSFIRYYSSVYDFFIKDDMGSCK